MKATALILLLLGCAAVPARTSEPSLSVWVDERVRLDSFLRKSFLAEISRGTAGVKPMVSFSSDSLRPSGHLVVVITLKTSPPRRYPNALGLARLQGGRILPALEVYLDPVAKLLPPNSPPTDLARALGRVAAHELIHYTSQRSGHDASGLFSESMGPDALVGASD
jgi:hypothetical protein